jgi:hypothetical protein
MKRAIRILLLMVGLTGTYIAIATPLLHAEGGGPILLCLPGSERHNCR